MTTAWSVECKMLATQFGFGVFPLMCRCRCVVMLSWNVIYPMVVFGLLPLRTVGWILIFAGDNFQVLKQQICYAGRHTPLEFHNYRADFIFYFLCSLAWKIRGGLVACFMNLFLYILSHYEASTFFSQYTFFWGSKGSAYAISGWHVYSLPCLWVFDVSLLLKRENTGRMHYLMTCLTK